MKTHLFLCFCVSLLLLKLLQLNAFYLTQNNFYDSVVFKKSINLYNYENIFCSVQVIKTKTIVRRNYDETLVKCSLKLIRIFNESIIWGRFRGEGADPTTNQRGGSTNLKVLPKAPIYTTTTEAERAKNAILLKFFFA